MCISQNDIQVKLFWRLRREGPWGAKVELYARDSELDIAIDSRALRQYWSRSQADL